MSQAQNRLAVVGESRAPSRPWTVRRSPVNDALANVPTRRFDVAWLDTSGEASSFARVAPAIPLFEEAFSALARGALVQTTDGRFAVEDLVPGMTVETEAGPEQLLWVGAITVMPDGPAGRGHKLYRVTADAFGLDRPMPDLMLGPSARVLSRAPAVQAATGSAAALAPIQAYADGASVVEVTPVSPVRVFHLGFNDHRILRANGVEVESFHPGQMNLGRLGPEMAALFMSMFPHIQDMAGFGRLALPRLSEEDLDHVFIA